MIMSRAVRPSPLLRNAIIAGALVKSAMAQALVMATFAEAQFIGLRKIRQAASAEA
jgi:hypothetical protein